MTGGDPDIYLAFHGFGVKLFIQRDRMAIHRFLKLGLYTPESLITRWTQVTFMFGPIHIALLRNQTAVALADQADCLA